MLGLKIRYPKSVCDEELKENNRTFSPDPDKDAPSPCLHFSLFLFYNFLRWTTNALIRQRDDDKVWNSDICLKRVNGPFSFFLLLHYEDKSSFTPQKHKLKFTLQGKPKLRQPSLTSILHFESLSHKPITLHLKIAMLPYEEGGCLTLLSCENSSNGKVKTEKLWKSKKKLTKL